MLRSAFLATLGLFATAGSLPAQTHSPAQSPPAASTPALEAPNSPEPMEDVQTGDHWTYEFRDDITGDVKSTITNTVTDVSDSEISTRTAVLGNPNSGYQTFDRSWNVINNSGIWRYTPNDGTGIRAPLAVGKTWSFKATDLNSTAGVSWRRSGTAKVVAQESVTTRAGTFDTFKIETSLQFQNANDPTKKYQAVLADLVRAGDRSLGEALRTCRGLEGRVREKSTTELVEYGRR